MRIRRALFTFVVVGAVVGCGSSTSPNGQTASPSFALLRYDADAATIEVLDSDLAVTATMTVENPKLTLPRSIDGAFLLDVTEEGATIYDLAGGKTRTIELPSGKTPGSSDAPPGFARFEVRTDTPSSSPWRLVDRLDLSNALLAIDAKTGEALSVGEEYPVEGIGRVESVGGVTVGITNGGIAQSIVVAIDGEDLSHRLIASSTASSSTIATVSISRSSKVRACRPTWTSCCRVTGCRSARH